MFRYRIKLINLLGFQVYIDLSWVVIAVLVTWSLAAGTFPVYYPGMATWVYWLMGVAGAIALFASIVVHEFSHSVVARYYGLPMKSITLFLFGGVAEMEEQPRSAGVEFAMAIAGPLASIVLGVIFLLLRDATAWSRPVTGVLSYLGIINLVLAAFNLLPAFPLDGGRVLRALLWRWKRDMLQATRISSMVGSAFGWLFVGLGVLGVLRGLLIGGIWLAFIGLFLRSLSSRSYASLAAQRSLEKENLRRFVDVHGATASPEMTVQDFVDEILYRATDRVFPVVSAGRLVGCIGRTEVRNTPRSAWPQTLLGQILRPCSAQEVLPLDTGAADALEWMRKHEVSTVFIVEGERFVGTVRLRMLLRFAATRADIEDIDQDKHEESA